MAEGLSLLALYIAAGTTLLMAVAWGLMRIEDKRFERGLRRASQKWGDGRWGT